MPPTDPLDLDATAQAAFVRRGEASPKELVEEAIGRIERLNPELNAVVTPLFDQARDTAAAAGLPDGPFRGVPFLLKDVGARSAGDPYTAGMALLRDTGYRARSDTAFAARLRGAGFVFLGKTNTPELGLQVTTEPHAYGPTHNPWNLDYSPGGSSGGSAAAVASGMVAAAHANDVGGSIRIPAGACGLVGLKPARGRVSWAPGPPAEFHLAVEHVVTRSVRDSAAILEVVSGIGPGDPYTAPSWPQSLEAAIAGDPGPLRVGVLDATGPGVLLETLGHHVETAHPPVLDSAGEAFEAWVRAMCVEVTETLHVLGQSIGRAVTAADVEPLTWAMNERGATLTALDLADALSRMHGFGRRLTGWWDDFDLLVTPTVPRPPYRLGELTPSAADPLGDWRRQLEVVRHTVPFNISGQPAISLPLQETDDGLPVGIQLVAAPFREDLLLAVAAQLERAVGPWRHPVIGWPR